MAAGCWLSTETKVVYTIRISSYSPPLYSSHSIRARDKQSPTPRLAASP